MYDGPLSRTMRTVPFRGGARRDCNVLSLGHILFLNLAGNKGRNANNINDPKPSSSEPQAVKRFPGIYWLVKNQESTVICTIDAFSKPLDSSGNMPDSKLRPLISSKCAKRLACRQSAAGFIVGGQPHRLLMSLGILPSIKTKSGLAGLENTCSNK